MSSITGQCGCGTTRLAVDRAPILVANCHCSLCQRQTGGPSVLNAFVEGEAIRITSGDTRTDPMPAPSGTQQIVRCAHCGTALWSHYPGLGTLLAMVRVPVLDEPSAFPPDVVLYAADSLPWATIPEGATVFDGPLVAREVLPPEQLDRMRALAARRKAGEGG